MTTFRIIKHYEYPFLNYFLYIDDFLIDVFWTISGAKRYIKKYLSSEEIRRETVYFYDTTQKGGTEKLKTWKQQ